MYITIFKVYEFVSERKEQSVLEIFSVVGKGFWCKCWFDVIKCHGSNRMRISVNKVYRVWTISKVRIDIGDSDTGTRLNIQYLWNRKKAIRSLFQFDLTLENWSLKSINNHCQSYVKISVEFILILGHLSFIIIHDF